MSELSEPRSKRNGTILGFVALAIAVGATIIWFRLAEVTAIPEDRTLFVIAFLLGPVLGITSFVIGTRWFGGIAAFLGIFVGSFLTFTVAISKQVVAENPVAVGDTIPHFMSLTGEDERFDSASLQGSPIFIKFFRAHW